MVLQMLSPSRSCMPCGAYLAMSAMAVARPTLESEVRLGLEPMPLTLPTAAFTGGWLEVGSWRLEVEGWKLEVGSWRLGVGGRCMWVLIRCPPHTFPPTAIP